MNDFKWETNIRYEGKVPFQIKNEKKNDNIEIESLRNEIQKLRYQNDSLNKINQKLREENENLKIQLAGLNLVKDQENKKIEEKYQNIGNISYDSKLNLNDNIGSNNYINLLEGENLVALNFISVNQCINHFFICNNKSKFFEIEKQLYDKFPEYQEGQNFFMFDGNRINRWKTLEDNGIRGYTIMLQRIET